MSAMKKWTEAEVKFFLLAQGFRTQLAEDLERNGANGEVLCMIAGGDNATNELKNLAELFQITPGDLLLIRARVSSYQKELESQPKHIKNQKKRKFGSDGGGVIYTLGARLPPERGSDGLEPAIEFKSGQSDMNAKDFATFFIERVAKFACGCINKRCNGTIFFGVGDNKVLLYLDPTSLWMQTSESTKRQIQH